eukprot:8435970-Prorocentrum_lima.AAC.1
MGRTKVRNKMTSNPTSARARNQPHTPDQNKMEFEGLIASRPTPTIPPIDFGGVIVPPCDT